MEYSTLDPSLPTYIRIPGPIPSTWAHRIVTLEEYEHVETHGYRQVY
jgi:hypothetical protein